MQIILKRFSLLFLSFLGLLFLASCEDTVTDEDIEPIPSITINPTSATIEPGESVTIEYSVIAEARIESIITFVNGNQFIVVDPSEFTNNDSHSGSITYTPNSEQYGTTVTITFEVTDRRDRVASRDFTLTVNDEIPEIPVSTFSARLLGAQNNANTGSFYDADENEIYLLSAARNNAAKIDFVYYYGATNLATLAAPADVTVEEVLPEITSFSTRNNTTLRRTNLTASEFNAVGALDGIQISTALETGTVPTEETRLNQLSVGDVVAFQTVEGRIGLALIDQISGTGAGSMTIDVKVID